MKNIVSSTKLNIRISEEEKRDFQYQADKNNMTVSEWCREILNNAIQKNTASDSRLDDMALELHAMQKMLSFLYVAKCTDLSKQDKSALKEIEENMKKFKG